MASQKFLSGIDLSKTELQNAVVQVLASDPSSPVLGQFYYNSGTNKLRQYNGSSWIEYGTSTASGDVTQSSNSGGAGRMKVSSGANKVIGDYAGGVGLVKSDADGVVSAAAAGTDYLTAASSNALTNKTFDANGTGNTLSNVETADFATNVIDNDSTLAANSTSRLPTQQAVKAYVDGKVTGLLEYQGSIDASSNPNFPAASKGDYYKISVAGKIGGASGTDVSAGDAIIANANNAGGTLASVGTSWDIIQANVEQSTTTALGLVELATQAETEAKTDAVRAVTPASLTNFTQKKIATIGDGSTTAIVVTDNLGTVDKIAEVRDASTNVKVLVDTTYASNTTTFTFATAPASNAYKVVIIG